MKLGTLSKLGLCLLLSACAQAPSKNKALSPSTNMLATNASFQGLPVQATEEAFDRWKKTYRELSSPKAAAIALDTEGKWVIGSSSVAPGTLPAAGAALADCEQKKNHQNINAPCELVRVNDHEFELGRALAKRLDLGDVSQPTFVWRLQKNNAVIYIGGSFHLFKQGFYPLPAAYNKAFDESSLLVLEVNPAATSPQELLSLQKQYLFLPDGKTLDQILPEPLLANAKRELNILGIEWRQVQKFTPAGFALNVISALYMAQGFLPQQGIDAHYANLAMQQSKEIGELETLEFQLQLLADMPFDLQTLQATDVFNETQAIDIVGKMVDAWHTADDKSLAALMNESSSVSPAMKAWNRRLLDERNIGMANKIAELLKTEDQTIFVLVGAGHLTGSGNVIELLLDHGIIASQLRRDGNPL